MNLSQIDILLSSLSISFVVATFSGIKIKPFSCVLCLTGWLSLCLALMSGYNWPYALLLTFKGWFVGAMFEGLKMRWL